ncbi:MAG: alanine racemase [Gammaproteobacteria bacterium]|nr:alanine racemase [Gammaproteobacteria bacterium]
MKRSSRLEINLDALTHNLSVVRKHANDANIIAVIKANAYGHGMLAVARHLAGKVDALAVACVSEAHYLRDNGIDSAIVVLQGFHNLSQLDLCFQLDLQPVCHQSWQIELLKQHQSDKQLSCWLKLDSGMHRLGVPMQDAQLYTEQLLKLAAVKKLRVMTHFASADEENALLNQQQLDAFNSYHAGLTLEASMANSAAILSLPDTIKDWVRPGLMLYGVSPFADKPASVFGLKPVMTLKSYVVAINQLPAGQAVGYGSCWSCSRDSQVAVVAIGYGDGYPRHASNGTPVLINGKRYPLVGRVSMDMITVDITATGAAIEIGDEVILWGEELDVGEVAECSTTIAYELLCNTGRAN